MTTEIIVSHAFCNDGLLAAYYGLERYPDAKVFYLTHADQDTQLLNQGFYENVNEETKQIFVMDYCLKAEILEKIWAINPDVKIVVLDHHKTSKDDMDLILERFKDKVEEEKLVPHFVMEVSGAVLAYIYFNGLMPEFINQVLIKKDSALLDDWLEKHVPIVSLYIMDRDIWKWKYKETSEPFTIGFLNFVTNIDELKRRIWNGELMNLTEMGRTILIYRDAVIEKAKKQFTEVSITLNGEVLKGLYGNTTVFTSDMLNAFLKAHPEYHFAIGYQNFGVHEWKVGVRSIAPFDSSVISKHFGGGGHPQASGFTFGNSEDFFQFHNAILNNQVTITL